MINAINEDLELNECDECDDESDEEMIRPYLKKNMDFVLYTIFSYALLNS